MKVLTIASLTLITAAAFNSSLVLAREPDQRFTLTLACPVTHNSITAMPSADQVDEILGTETAGSSDARLKAILKLVDSACKQGAAVVKVVPSADERANQLASR